MNLLAIALIAHDALGILTRARQDAPTAHHEIRMAEADRGVREATRWLAYVREHGTPAQLLTAEHLLLEWRSYRTRLERGQQQ